MIYQIRIKGHLGDRWTDWFGGLTVTQVDGDTLLTGAVDQAALHGLLKRVRDLGMTLVSVLPLEADEAGASEAKV
ncbi:MAG: hypothetical protein ACYC6T_13610 [Thermoleophilia bacterium]